MAAAELALEVGVVQAGQLVEMPRTEVVGCLPSSLAAAPADDTAPQLLSDHGGEATPRAAF